MSYSFNVRGANKAEAKAAVAAKFAEIVQQQPIHARDAAAVQANADNAIDLLNDDDTRDISVSVNGSLSWFNADTERLSAVSISSMSSLVPRANVGVTIHG